MVCDKLLQNTSVNIHVEDFSTNTSPPDLYYTKDTYLQRFIVLLLIVNVTSKKETGFFLVFKVRPVLFRVVFMTLPSVYDGDFMPK